MPDSSRRQELRGVFDQSHPEAGVYRIVNQRTRRVLIGSAQNLAAAGNRLAFARSTRSTGALDHRLVADAREFGFEVFSFEVLDRLHPAADIAPQRLREELALLEELWRDREDPNLLY